MGNNEDEDFYRNLSRKELQGLCKKYGLSSNKTNSHLAKLLVSYFKKNNSSSVPSEERSSGPEESFFPTSFISKLQSRALLNSMREAHKGMHEKRLVASDANSRGPNSCSDKEADYETSHSQTVNHNELGCCMGAQISNKASGATTNLVLRDPSGNGTSKGFGCSTYDLRETTRSRFGFQCEGHGFNIKKNKSFKVTESKYSDQNLLGPAKEGGAGSMLQFQCRNRKIGACPAENAFASPEVPPSSFQFYVRSEEGINLYVDLCSSPSDWIKSMKNEVSFCRKVPHNKSGGLHQELRNLGDGEEQMKNSFPWNTESSFQTNGGPLDTGSSPNTVVRDSGHVGADYPEGIDGSLRSSAIIPCSTPLEISVQLEDDRALSSSSRPNFDEQNVMVSGIESCLRDKEIVTFDSEVPETCQIKLAYNSIISSKSGPKWTDSFKHQSSKFGSTRPEDYETGCTKNSNVSLERGPLWSDGICEDLTPFNTASLVKPSVVCPGCSTSGSTGMQLSEVASHCKDASELPCKNGGPLDLVDPVHNIEREHEGSTNCVLNQEKCMGPQSACPDELERSNLMTGRESSECSQIDNSLEKTCKRSHNLEFHEGLQRKRQLDDSEDDNGHTEPDVKNLRSSNHPDREALPRRSRRLISK